MCVCVFGGGGGEDGLGGITMELYGKIISSLYPLLNATQEVSFENQQFFCLFVKKIYQGDLLHDSSQIKDFIKRKKTAVFTRFQCSTQIQIVCCNGSFVITDNDQS